MGKDSKKLLRQGSHVEDLEDTIKQITRKRDLLVSKIRKIRKGLVDKSISIEPHELECRLEMLESHIKNVTELEAKLEDIDLDYECDGALEELYISTKGMLKALISQIKVENSQQTPIAPQASSSSRLPKMALPKFSGKYSEFKNFLSLFETLVDNDKSLPNIEKFNHLMQCLSGEALGTIKAFHLSNENYPKALAALKKVYDNDCLIFLDNISMLFELPRIEKPSSSALRSLIDTVSAVFDSLLTIGDEKCITNAIIVHLVMSKVDSTTKKKWEESLDYQTLPSWANCEEALNRRFQHMVAEESSTTSKLKLQKTSREGAKPPSTHMVSKVQKAEVGHKCVFCSSNEHFITTCTYFCALPQSERLKFVKSKTLCYNCLRKGHRVPTCKFPRCSICSKSHSVLLHIESSQASTQNTAVQEQRSALHISNTIDHVMLATAIVKIRSKSGEYLLARALLDSGSQINFVTEEMVQKLKLDKISLALDICGIGESKEQIKHKANVVVKSRVNNFEISSDFWVLKSITRYHPDSSINTNKWPIPANVELADPYFNKPQKIDLLLGAEVFFELLEVGQLTLGENNPILQKTVFGWVVSGRCGAKNLSTPPAVCNLAVESSQNEGSVEVISTILQRFWALEEIPRNPLTKFTKEHLACEKHFVDNTVIKSDKIYVRLPFKGDYNDLGSSFETAKRRFLWLEKRLSKTPDVKQMYVDFMTEYIELGHMSVANFRIPQGPHYFIPHQVVLRPQSTSTKLRVVFDASCRSSSQLSLNEILMVGPTIQKELYSTLLKFRFHKYALTADIKKMYRQVFVADEDRNFQLIVWRKNENDPLQTFRLNTVTYGTSPAPFLAIRSLKMLSELYKDSHPIGSRIVANDFYVDDLLTGADDIETLKQIKREVSEVLEPKGLELAKWFSNHDLDFSQNQNIERQMPIEESTTKTLGLHWNPSSDIFTFLLDMNFDQLKVTKRNILSVSARLFDPLGLLCPVVVKAKILLQELWILKLDWDESIPQHLHTDWQIFKETLSHIGEIQIPRYVNTTSDVKIEIHGFSDSSIRAYGCCIYVRTTSSLGTRTCLLTAKSKVAPLKTKSLPRLELCAAHLLSLLWKEVSKLLEFPIEQVVFWTDSEIVLYWLQSHPSTLQSFVGNRVAEIQECAQSITWRHVPTKVNPADLVSRGCSVQELKDSFWFTGPDFLLQDEINWPVNSHFDNIDKNLEKKKSKVVLAVVNDQPNIFVELSEKYSSYMKFLRIFALVLRFIFKLRKCLKDFPTEILSPPELNIAFFKIVQILQETEFPDEIKKLKQGSLLSPHIQKLNPFLDNDSNDQFPLEITLVRVGGRLSNAPLAMESKFPLLLGKTSYFVKSYLRYLHLKNHHIGPTLLKAILRERIWVINSQEICTKVVRDCVRCFRYRPKLLSQIMGNLPADRVTGIRPFLVSGVDFCGPVNVTLKIRGRSPVKMYIAIFVCFASKAVHIELVSDLSSERFIFSLKRFIARRGRPRTLYCDNGRNFVGAERQLRELHDSLGQESGEIQRYAAEEAFKIAFIPPRAPHFGGLWEAAVKSTKLLLLRTIGEMVLSSEDLQTLLAEVEAILNSRPIAPLSSDPSDGEALTPGHFLIGAPILSLPPEPVPDSQLRCLSRWQTVCWLRHRFWQMWSKIYVTGLQQRNKWCTEEPNIERGILVIVKEDNMPPQKWITGRVIDVQEGEDGKVRVADIKTPTGVIRRAIHRLAVLPGQNIEADSFKVAGVSSDH